MNKKESWQERVQKEATDVYDRLARLEAFLRDGGAEAAGAFVNPRVAAAMHMAGILGEDGMVDVDKLDAFSKAAFKAQPRVDTPFSISFEQADADAFIARLRQC